MHTTGIRTSLQYTAALVAAALCLCSGCTRPDDAAPPEPEQHVLTETFGHGRVTVTLRAEPAQVHYERDTMLTITVTSPGEFDVVLPDFEDRLGGFLLAGEFDEKPLLQDGQKVLTRHLRLTPVLATEHRLAPFAVRYADRSTTPAAEHWFATRPITFDVRTLTSDGANDIDDTMKPVWVRPTFATIALIVAGVLALPFIVLLLRTLFRKLHRQVQLMRMSPRERALQELDLLLNKQLVEKNEIKQFYLELTMIVRRYIERANGVRAPEQTTEEFLAAVSADPRFSPMVVNKLKAFLQAADLVKFAAYQPDAAAITNATDTARDYIETDTAAQSDGEEA